jgi:hypothetical protein
MIMKINSYYAEIPSLHRFGSAVMVNFGHPDDFIGAEPSRPTRNSPVSKARLATLGKVAISANNRS